MGELISARLEKRQTDAIEEMVENGNPDNASEALRTAVDVGLSELGYQNGVRRDTMLRRTIRRSADGFALLSVFWIGVTFFLPIGFRGFAIPIFLIGLVLYGVDGALKRYEPHVSNWVSNRIIGVITDGTRREV